MKKYYDSQKVKLGDTFTGGWCGTCRVIKNSKYKIVAKNILTKEVFELNDYMEYCDLIQRKS